MLAADASRNRRMFDLIQGTLRDFESEAARTSEQHTRRQEIVDKAVARAQLQTLEAREQRLSLLQQRREKLSELRRLEEERETSEQRDIWPRYAELLANSIRLSTAPAIFYSPAKHNPMTRDLLQRSADAIRTEYAAHLAAVEQTLAAPPPRRDAAGARDSVRDDNDGDSDDDRRDGRMRSATIEADAGEARGDGAVPEAAV